MQYLACLFTVEFLKFGAVGTFNCGVDWGLFYLLNWLLKGNYLLAKALSFTISAISAYLLNRYWTFKSKDTDVLKQSLKYFVVSVVGLLINLIIMYVVVGIFHQRKIFGLILATGLVAFWNYFCNKFWTFKDTLKKRQPLASE